MCTLSRRKYSAREKSTIFQVALILNENRKFAAEDVASFLFKKPIGFAFVRTNLITENNDFAKDFTETLNENAS